MTVGIYGIFDAHNNECLYVGLSKNIEQRWKSHLKELKSKSHKRKDFVEWYHSNGAVPDLIVLRVLEECEYDNGILNVLEIKWFNKMSPKYYGKKPSLNEKWKHSEETKIKIANSLYKGGKRITKSCVCGSQFTTKIDSSMCLECSLESQKKEFEKKYKKIIIKKFINENKSARTISKELGLSKRKVTAFLKHEGFALTNTGFKGKKHNKESLKKIQESSIDRFSSIKNYTVCLKCKRTFNSVPAQKRKYCSRECYSGSFV